MSVFRTYTVRRSVTGSSSVICIPQSDVSDASTTITPPLKPSGFNPAPPELLRLFFEDEYEVEAVLGIIDGAVVVRERITPLPEKPTTKQPLSSRQEYIQDLQRHVSAAQHSHNNGGTLRDTVEHCLNALAVIVAWEKRHGS